MYYAVVHIEREDDGETVAKYYGGRYLRLLDEDGRETNVIGVSDAMCRDGQSMLGELAAIVNSVLTVEQED